MSYTGILVNMGVQFDDLPFWEFTAKKLDSGCFEFWAVRDGGINASETSVDTCFEFEDAFRSLRSWALRVEDELRASESAGLVERHTPFEPSTEQLISELWLGADLLWAGVLSPEFLPSIATDFLIRGVDTPALRNLAGLDLQPFDPRDAADVFADVMLETHMPTSADDARLERVAEALAVAWSDGHIDTPAILKHFYRLAVTMEYPDHDEVMRLYALGDEWEAGWGGTNSQIEAEIGEIMSTLTTGRITTPEVILTATGHHG